jgi:hypothetical protein
MTKRLPPVRRTRVERPASPLPVLGSIPTPADHYAKVIAEAVEWTATSKIGQGRYDTRRAPTLEGARQHARDMGEARTLIYAIDPLGRQVLVEAGGRPVTP